MADTTAPAARAPTRSIRAWMLAVSLSATVPMLALLVGVTLWLQHEQGLQREASMQRQALRAADAVASTLATQRARIATVAVGVAAREQRLEVLHQVLQAVAATDPAITSISFVDALGRRVLDSRMSFGQPLPPSGVPVIDQRVLSTGVDEVSPLTKGSISGRLVVGVAVPVRDDAERTVGVLRLVLNPTLFDRQLMRLATQPGWVVAVVDQHAVIVARNQVPEPFRGQRATDSLVAQLQRPAGDVHHGETRDGRRVLAVVAPVGGTGWHVAVGASEAEVDRAERQTLLIVVGTGLLVVLVSGAGSLWLGQRMAQQVARVAQGQGVQDAGIRELRHIGQRIDAADAALAEARHDTLTGLPARGLFVDTASRALEQLVDEQRLALLYLDLDGFKSLNDTQGHEAGDQALVRVARALSQALRPGDVAARLGGDEFVVLLPCTGASAQAMCEGVAARLRADIAALGTGLGCSVGWAVALPGDTLGPWLDAADRAMLRAKAEGRPARPR
jgi:diguanylate cyclase (GGDEF)-like protein